MRLDVQSVPAAQEKLPFDPQLIDLKKSADARRLFELEQLEVTWDEPTGSLWTFMRPRGRPSYNIDLLDDFHAWQRGILATFEESIPTIYATCCSVRARLACSTSVAIWIISRQGSARAIGGQLVAYGKSCVRILHRNIECLGLPMVTIGLAQGDALVIVLILLSFNVSYRRARCEVRISGKHFRPVPGHGSLQPGGAPSRCSLR